MLRMKTQIVSIFLFTILLSCNAPKHTSEVWEAQVVSRKQWNAAAPVLPMKLHTPKKITIHPTATKQNFQRTLRQKLLGLQKFSQEKSSLSNGKIKEPWADIPYHFYIDVHGTIGEGRPLQFVGDSNTAYDPTGHALIVLEGNFNEEAVSEKQWLSLQKLAQSIANKYHIKAEKISGHKDHASTACPGNNLYQLIPILKQMLQQPSKTF